MKSFFLLTFIYQILPFLLFAQENQIKFERLSAKDGLSHGSVQAILQDREGFMWFGTKDGLNRYDGYNFVTYEHDPTDSTSISDNSIRSICEDQSGNLWIGTFMGLNKFDKNTQRITPFIHDPANKGSISDNNIQSVYIDHNGTLWVGTYLGLNKYDKTTNAFTLFQYDPVLPIWPNSTINTIFEDRNGSLWVGTNKGLSLFNVVTGKFTRFLHYTQPADSVTSKNSVVAICEDKSGNLWTATAGDGLKQFNKQTHQFVTYKNTPTNPNSLSSDRVLSLHIDSFGILWIGTQFGGLNRFDIDTGKFTSYQYNAQDNNSITHHTVISIYEDRFKVLWVGAYAGGVSKYNLIGKKFHLFQHHLNDTNTIQDNSVFALYSDRSGAVWVGTTKGLDRIDNKNGHILHYILSDFQTKGSSSHTVHCIHEDKTGNLWVGLGGAGLKKFNPSTKQFKTFSFKTDSTIHLPNDFINFIHEDKKGILWLCTRNGLYKFDPFTEKFTTYRPSFASRPLYNVNHIKEDKQGILWLATAMDGLNTFDPEKEIFTQYPYSENKLEDVNRRTINYLHEDKSGVWWVCMASGGLYQFDKKTSQFIVQPKELSRIVIHAITEDIKGNLWLSTRKSGIYKYNSLTKSVQHYDIHDGLQSNEFNKAACRGTNGDIYVGGNNGFNVFNPDLIQANPYAPPVVITSFKVFDQPRSLSKNEIELSYLENFFSLDFAALHYALPEKNTYAYKMENFNQNWINTGTRRYVSYTNLDPGDYVLKVKAANADGVWNNQVTTIKITITPPFWKTIWAYLFYGIAFIGLLYGLRQYTIGQERLKNKLTLKSLESAKLQEIDAIKSKFFTNISHEFRTPLTLVISPLETFLKQKNKYDEELPIFELMHRNVKRLLQLVNQLLDISKIEAGSMQLHTKSGNLIHFIKTLVSSFASIADSQQIKLNFHTDMDVLWVEFDKDKLEKILSNLLANAFKFTPAKGQISVTITEKPSEENSRQEVQIGIQDSGIGIAQDQLTKIFDLFYQVDPSPTRAFGGTGIGLSLVKELVELHGGNITVKSDEGKGTNFMVNLHFVKSQNHESTEQFAENNHDSMALLPANDNSFNNGNSDEQAPLLLLVEDNTDLRKYIRSIFERNYQILEATDGEEGMKIAIETIPDVIISDWMMPKMDGVELCDRLKTDECTSHIPIILLTAKATIESRLQGLQRGADAYLTKPFHTDELIIQVKNLITQRKRLREYFSRELTFTPQATIVSSTNKNPDTTANPADERDVLTLSLADEKFLQKVISTIEKNIDNSDFNVEMLQKEIDMSHLQVYRKLKALTNESPSELIRKLRLKKAAILLLQKEYTISQIAYLVGINNLSYFTRAFRQEYGMTPSEYSSQQKQ